MAAAINDSAWLEWVTGLMGGVSRQTHAAAFPPDKFYCLLDELPLHLIPRPTRTRFENDELHSDLVLNPDCTLCVGAEVPTELASRRDLLSGLAIEGTIAWVRDSGRGWLPFWLGPELEQIVRKLTPDAPIETSVRPIARRLLAAANIIVPRPNSSRNARAGQNANAASQFQEKGYALVPGLLHPFHVAALRRYYRQRIRSGAISLGDRQSSRRYTAHNEPVARFFHHQITSTFSEVAGHELRPSYVYMASYLSGAELKKHTDREQCEFSITLCLDFSPEPTLATPWPIHLKTPKGVVAVYQVLGDGLAYRGTRLAHYRSVLPEGQTSTSIFFHYVGRDFRGSLD